MWGEIMAIKTPARIHAILARNGDSAVVFRRGPSNKVATIAWDRNTDAFTVGQWLRGRIYEYRCDLSPDGKYLLYFAAKYGRANPVNAQIEELVQKQIGEPDWRSESQLDAYFQKRETLEKKIRKTYAVKLDRMRRSPDYTDASWTAISRAPYLKALDLWFNGSGWNGGGWFIDAKQVWLNVPLLCRGSHNHHLISGKFKERHQPPDPRLITQNAGECPGIYLPRLERDGWKAGKETETYDEFAKDLPGDLVLIKRFHYGQPGRNDEISGYGCYWEDHKLCRHKDLLSDGSSWRWSDYDAKRHRIVFAANGAMYALSLQDPEKPPVLLYDFNDLKYEATPAPY